MGIKISGRPVAGGFSVGDVLVGNHAGATSQFPYRRIVEGVAAGSPAVAATGTLTFTANPTNGQTYAISGTGGTVTFTFKTSPAGGNDVAIDPDLEDTMQNFLTAIASLLVGRASAAIAGTAIVFTALSAGAAGNDLVGFAGGSAPISASGPGLAGGCDQLFVTPEEMLDAGSTATGTANPGTPSVGNSFSIGGVLFTYVSGAPSTSTQIQSGATLMVTRVRLRDAINANPQTGVTAAYSIGDGGGAPVALKAISPGAAGNDIALVNVSGSVITFSGPTLTGGGDDRGPKYAERAELLGEAAKASATLSLSGPLTADRQLYIGAITVNLSTILDFESDIAAQINNTPGIPVDAIGVNGSGRILVRAKVPGEAGNTIGVGIDGGSELVWSGSTLLGGAEPQPKSPVVLRGTYAFEAGAQVADGDVELYWARVTGAVPGDIVLVSITGQQLVSDVKAWVQDPDIVTIKVGNETGALVDLEGETAKIMILR